MRRPRGPIVLITTRGGPHAGASAEVLRRRATKMLVARGLVDVELSLALVDDETIRQLNAQHRKKDKPTDVLSFPQLELAPPGDEARGPIGDVIISVPTARRQASRRRRPLLAELTMLLAHGVLHLLGYDHQTDAEERVMTGETRALEHVAARRAGGVASKTGARTSGPGRPRISTAKPAKPAKRAARRS